MTLAGLNQEWWFSATRSHSQPDQQWRYTHAASTEEHGGIHRNHRPGTSITNPLPLHSRNGVSSSSRLSPSRLLHRGARPLFRHSAASSPAPYASKERGPGFPEPFTSGGRQRPPRPRSTILNRALHGNGRQNLYALLRPFSPDLVHISEPCRTGSRLADNQEPSFPNPGRSLDLPQEKRAGNGIPGQDGCPFGLTRRLHRIIPARRRSFPIRLMTTPGNKLLKPTRQGKGD